MRSVEIEGKVWFSFTKNEIEDLVFGIISAKVDDKMHLDEFIDLLTVSRQMEIKRNISRYNGLQEQLARGKAWIHFDNVSDIQ